MFGHSNWNAILNINLFLSFYFKIVPISILNHICDKFLFCNLSRAESQEGRRPSSPANNVGVLLLCCESQLLHQVHFYYVLIVLSPLKSYIILLEMFFWLMRVPIFVMRRVGGSIFTLGFYYETALNRVIKMMLRWLRGFLSMKHNSPDPLNIYKLINFQMSKHFVPVPRQI